MLSLVWEPGHGKNEPNFSWLLTTSYFSFPAAAVSPAGQVNSDWSSIHVEAINSDNGSHFTPDVEIRKSIIKLLEMCNNPGCVDLDTELLA